VSTHLWWRVRARTARGLREPKVKGSNCRARLDCPAMAGFVVFKEEA
jgi:hypothetical protein